MKAKKKAFQSETYLHIYYLQYEISTNKMGGFFLDQMADFLVNKRRQTWKLKKAFIGETIHLHHKIAADKIGKSR